jgi:anti-anti-sigma regulatory factor
MTAAGSMECLRLGDHACVLIDDDAAKTRALTAYIQAGLRNRHRILYFGEAEPQIAAAVPDALRSGQVRMATAESTYLASGVFDPEATIQGWRDESARALRDGYRGLRAAGDMSWASRPVPGADRLAWYEAHVNRVFADGFAMAVCIYDRRLFTTADLRRVSWAHLATVDGESDPATVPLLRAVRTTDPPGIALHGEADLSNRHALRALLENLVADAPATDGRLTLDVSGMRFIDAAASRILTAVAAAHAPRLRVIGCSPAVQRLLAFNGANVGREPRP